MVVTLLALPGCTKTVYHAVLVPQRALDNGHGCFQRCQLAYAGQTKHFLMLRGCLSRGPRLQGKQCNEVKYDVAEHHCTTVRQQTFDGWSTALGISLAVLVNILVVRRPGDPATRRHRGSQ